MSEDVKNPRNLSLDFSRIKINEKSLENAILSLASIKTNLSSTRSPYTDKGYVMRAIATNDIEKMREISKFYYNASGIYQKFCHYIAYMYRYDWYLTTELIPKSNVKEDSVIKDFMKTLNFFDNSYVKKICGDMALQAVINGSYYGYIVPNPNGLQIQQLPEKYCRSRFFAGMTPAVEFNMRFFDEKFTNPAYRQKILKMFPKEFQKGFELYRKKQLIGDGDGLTGIQDGWYLLDPNNTLKFSFHINDAPFLINAIPAIIDLDVAQGLERQRQLQKLTKIIIQKLPRDKNDDLIFDNTEAADIHNNAVEMLRNVVGTDVLTTFTDVDSIDLSDRTTSASVDELSISERAVFNSVGISQNLFNTDGNLSLEKSVLNDESSVRNFLFQLEMFFDKVALILSKEFKKYTFRFKMLETTQYNYKELSKMYKEQAQLGSSKMLSQIALGHSQSFILNTAHFENEILHLSEVMIPPLMSSTLNGEDILNRSKSKSQSNGEVGRPEKPDDEKSEKTIQNRESSGQ